MRSFKEAYKSIFRYCTEHGSHENSFHISNMHWMYFIPIQSFMSILHMGANWCVYLISFWTTTHTDDEEKHRVMSVTKEKWCETEFLNSGGFQSHLWTTHSFPERSGLIQYLKFR